MGEAAMELSSEQKDYIGSYIRDNLKLWIGESGANQIINEREMEIRERIIRVEESIDKHIALTKAGFDQMDKRFELLTGQMDKRFEQVDKRFEQVDKRFESIDSRFNRLTGLISLGFLVITVLITISQFLG